MSTLIRNFLGRSEISGGFRCLELISKAKQKKMVLKNHLFRCKIHSTSRLASSVGSQHGQQNRPIVDNLGTIDEKEIDHFNKLSQHWWDEGGPLKTLHFMNELRVPLIRDAIVPNRNQNEEKCLDGKWIVDVGCGGGILSEPLARLGSFVLGLDASKEGIEVAQRHALLDPDITKNLKYVHGQLEDLVLTECGKFDAVVASEVIEHVNDAPKFTKMCCDLVKPGGTVIMSTFNQTPLSYLMGIVAAEHVLGIVPKGTHEYEKFIPIEDLKKMFLENGMDVKLVHGFIYNPLTHRWSWINSQQFSYAIVAQKRHSESELSQNTGNLHDKSEQSNDIDKRS